MAAVAPADRGTVATDEVLFAQAAGSGSSPGATGASGSGSGSTQPGPGAGTDASPNSTSTGAELTDNDGWTVLADLAEQLGHDDLAQRFQEASSKEEQHLAQVRAWLSSATDAQAGLQSPGFDAAAPEDGKGDRP